MIAQAIKSADGTTIYAEAVGDSSKPSIVWIHGFSLSGTVFDKQFEDPQWTDSVYQVRYDMRGHGRSGKPENESAYESRRFAEDFDAVVSTFALERPFVACWSLGGVTGADIFSFHPSTYLSGLIWIAGVPYTSAIPQMATPFVFTVLPGFTETTDVNLFQRKSLAFVDKLSATPLPHPIRQALLGDIMTQPRVVALRVLTRVQETEGLLDAGQTGLPLLVMYAKNDELVRGERALDLLKAPQGRAGWKGWKNLTSAEVDSGHMPFWEKPEEFKQTVLAFMQQVHERRAETISRGHDTYVDL